MPSAYIRNPIDIQESGRESITVLSVRIRVSIPAAFGNATRAAKLVKAVERELAAESAVVIQVSFNANSMAIDFTLPDTMPDRQNLIGIRDMVEECCAKLLVPVR